MQPLCTLFIDLLGQHGIGQCSETYEVQEIPLCLMDFKHQN